MYEPFIIDIFYNFMICSYLIFGFVSNYLIKCYQLSYIRKCSKLFENYCNVGEYSQLWLLFVWKIDILLNRKFCVDKCQISKSYVSSPKTKRFSFCVLAIRKNPNIILSSCIGTTSNVSCNWTINIHYYCKTIIICNGNNTKILKPQNIRLLFEYSANYFEVEYECWSNDR